MAQVLYQRNIITHLRSFLAMIKKELLVVLRYPLNFFGQFISIIFWVLIFFYATIPFQSPTATPGQSDIFVGSILWGSILFFLLSDAIWAIGMSIFWEQRTGTLEQLFLAPVKQWLMLIARSIRSLLTNSFVILWMIAIVYALTGFLIIVNPLLGIYILIISIISFLGFGFMYAALVIWIKQPHMISNILQFIFLILCAMFFPFSVLPSQILIISRLIPFSYNVDAFRAAMMGHTPELITDNIQIIGYFLSPLEFELLLLHIFAIVFLVIGSLTYRYTVNNALKQGTLGAH